MQNEQKLSISDAMLKAAADAAKPPCPVCNKPLILSADRCPSCNSTFSVEEIEARKAALKPSAKGCIALSIAAILMLGGITWAGFAITGSGSAGTAEASEATLLNELDDNAALIMCKYYAEASAKFDYEWEGLFGIPNKKGIDRKVTPGGDVTVTVYADGLKLQNGFGAWSRHSFICEVSTKSKSVTGFQIF